ncbi:MAG: hypothetical protein AAFR23_03825 [Pseudomonadota bacterium]
MRADTLSTSEALVRAGITNAARVIVRGSDDDETLAATLAASSLTDTAHIVAYFEDERAADLISRQCPQVEAIGSLTVELLVRASRDPGSSRVADRLLSSETSDTAFSMTVPAGVASIAYFDALIGLKRRYDMTLVGLADAKAADVDLNCSDEAEISGGDVIYYIADRRTPPDEIDWKTLAIGGAASEATQSNAVPDVTSDEVERG